MRYNIALSIKIHQNRYSDIWIKKSVRISTKNAQNVKLNENKKFFVYKHIILKQFN